jgi:hypothetical protein
MSRIEKLTAALAVAAGIWLQQGMTQASGVDDWGGRSLVECRNPPDHALTAKLPFMAIDS